MNKSEKFLADLQRIKKRNRAGAAFNMNGALRDIESLFTAQNGHCKGLALSLFDWWKNECARGAEFEDEALEKIAALHAFVNGEEEGGVLSADDWSRIKDEVGYEAENIPMDLLSSMMQTVVEKGGMN